MTTTIKPKHPFECYNTQQEIFLKHIHEKDREYHTLRISYNNAMYLYYKLQLIVSPYDYREWINGIIDKKFRNDMLAKGFEACKKSFSFIRFMKTKRNITEQDYIKNKMGEERYTRYRMLC